MPTSFYVGEVRAINSDPTKSGCAQVRIYNQQNDEQQIKDDDLIWCPVLHPYFSPATAGIGMMPTGLLVGSRVLVANLEGDDDFQSPIILGCLGRGDVPPKKGVSKEPDQKSGGKITYAAPDSPFRTET